MSIPPFEPRIERGLLYGRGACDTKAGLAGMMLAVARAKREGSVPACEVWMASVVDEEHSCLGVLRLCQGLAANAAIVAEPTELKAVIASKGVLRWRMVAHGRSAHSSKIELGVNAIHHMARLVVALERYHSELESMTHPLLGRATANVGRIVGGVQVNFVPDRCEIEIDRRLLPGENPDTVIAGYRALVDQLQSSLPNARFEIEPPNLVDRGLDTPSGAAIAQCAQQVLSNMGMDTHLGGVAFGSDASKLHEAGIASILFGPGSIDQAHTADEYVPIDQVYAAHEFYFSMIQEFGV
jgi:acetylornithine deacetylase